MEDELTHDDIKRMALHGGLANLLMVLDDNPLMTHLGLAAQLHRHGREMSMAGKRLRAVATGQEHRELADAMRDAGRAAQLAFDAAVNAVWQMHWLAGNCECEECVQDRRRDKAEHN